MPLPLTRTPCWCGEIEGPEIGPDYRRCAHCGTGVVSVMPPGAHFTVQNDERDFYGKSYWLEHQKTRGLPDVVERARTDPSERCLFWLERLLENVSPPGRALEIGCGHGAFVALLRELGFDAIGVDLSGWVVEFARKTFGVSVLQGTLETLDLEPGFTCVAAFDVLEHLVDPLETMRRCRRLLAPNGVVLLQTPCYRGEDHDWPMFQKDEHIYLFTEASVRDLLKGAGFNDIRIRSSFFPYDMWIAATPGTLTQHSPMHGVSRDSQLPLAFRALLDLHTQTETLRRSLAEAETDRAERLRQMGELTEIARKGETDRVSQVEELTAQTEKLTGLLREAETDRAARLGVIQGAEAQIQALNGEMQTLRSRLEHHETVEVDQIAQIETLTGLLQEAEADRAARLDVIHGAEAQIQTLNAEIQTLWSLLERHDTGEAGIEDLTRRVDELTASAQKAEADRIAQIEALTAQVEEITAVARRAETDRIAQVEEIAAQLERVTARTWKAEINRIAQVEELARQLRESEADRAARLEVIRGADAQVLALHAEIKTLRNRLERIEGTPVWRAYRTFTRKK